MKILDSFLNSITMYRLVVYYLVLLVVAGIILATFGLMPFNPFALGISCIFLLVIGWLTNKVFAGVFEVPANVESVYISALILTLIITPVKSFHDFGFLFWAAVLTMASKFILAVNRKHLFNPAAFAVALTAFAINGTASWWVGSLAMLPFVLTGILVVVKTRRFNAVFYFFAVYFLVLFAFDVLAGANPLVSLQKSVTDTPLLFFAFIMLTEPLTMPPTANLQAVYGGLIGLLLVPKVHLGSVYSTPELALLVGNVFSYLVSPKFKLLLTLKEKVKLGEDIYDFVFTADRRFSFIPGQYMEWTYAHPNTDDRGNRRYFTLANSPTEEDVRLGIKFYPNSSSYKRNLLDMNVGAKILAGSLMGDFVLPKDRNQKLVFVAGGIGITPFRSMLKDLIDLGEKRDIVVLYTDKTQDKFVYQDILNTAEKVLGIKTLYVATESAGHADANYITTNIPDYRDRTFYVSGSNRMVKGFEDLLSSLNLPKSQVVTDFFPGLM